MKSTHLLIICSLLLVACQPKSQITEIVNEPSYSADLSVDGRYVLVSTANNGLQLWDLQTKTQKYQWTQDDSQNSAIDTKIANNLKYAASLSNHSVALWSMENGQSLGWWSLPSTGQSLAISDTGSLLIGLTDGSVMSLDPANNSLIKFLGHSEKVNSVALSNDGTLALTGANDKQVILWHAKTGQPIHTWALPTRAIKVAISQDGSLVFAADSTNQGLFWQASDGQTLGKLNISRRQMNFSAARFTNDNKHLLTGTPAREVSLWQISNGKMLANWRVSRTEHAQIKGAVVYSVAEPTNNHISSISSNGLLETWSLPVQ
ncbi:WD40 repeat domain-containing protein [Shewanella colwelliana]|uniref:Uncharacterized protein n=1 Tax=Shewanella colwelliana TaxID=23 RepID=A0ABQ4PDB7_SHECO|nr:hypothetical protein [Shewanella colwelliana]GIU45540.1 hypothetical protein TUM3794_36080 [Shewanella colwelliana]